jgi:hypothetical protein
VVVIRRPCSAVAGHELCSHKFIYNHIYRRIGRRDKGQLTEVSECRTTVLELVRNVPKMAPSRGVASSPRILRASGACVVIITRSKYSTLPSSKRRTSFPPSGNETFETEVDLCNRSKGIPARMAATYCFAPPSRTNHSRLFPKLFKMQWLCKYLTSITMGMLFSVSLGSWTQRLETNGIK